MIRGRIVGALAGEADDSAATDVHEPSDQMPLPTLEERANFYLRAVHGDRKFTNEERSRARNLMMKAMAADIAARSLTRSPDRASLSVQSPDWLTALPNPFLEIAPLAPGDEPGSIHPSAGGATPGEHRASDQDAEAPREAHVALARPRRLRAIPDRRLPTLFSPGQINRRTAAVWGAVAVAAAVVLWLGGALTTAWFAPNTASRDSRVAVQSPLPGTSDRMPPGSDQRAMAEAQREIISALNDAQLRPDEIATLLKRGQELIANGKFRLARLVLEQAAEAGSAPAALALGRTYDPVMREGLRPDAAPDIAMARAWYEKAKDLGSPEAARRLGQLSAPVVPSSRK
jgi:hypothetical protein